MNNSGLRNALSILAALTPVAIVLLAAVVVFFARPAYPRDNGQWEATPHDIREWYQNLKQPDNPRVSCCGEADAYWADSYVVEGGKTYAIITDTRDNELLGRIPRPNGSRYHVPDQKMKHDAGNPTGHGVLFIGGTGDVLCYVTPGGV